ncbi:MAG: lipoyl synthase [Syntrophobacterales bacterium]|nr:lipoyl synthase [Syntrophobacterales bacterium]
MNSETQILKRKPPWLRRNLPKGAEYQAVRELLRKNRLHTVCEEALCPNIWECFSRGTATFLIMGSLCTRGCRFCAMSRGKPAPLDSEEPSRVAGAARQLDLTYVVVTSVTRDDLPDGGASFFSDTITKIHKDIPGVHVEVLIPDFQGDVQALASVIRARPDVLNHNIETVPRLYPAARPDSSYGRSLALLERVKKDAPAIPVKSGIMLGLGETSKEIRQTLRDLADAGCDILTMGQYLQPSKKNLAVERFVHPDEFDDWRVAALEMEFSGVVSGPLVRSSYRAGELYRTVVEKTLSVP